MLEPTARSVLRKMINGRGTSSVYSCIFRQAAVLTQKFINHHATRRGDVERVLVPQHRNSHVCVAEFEQSRIESIDFMSEQNAHRKNGLPVEQIDGMDAG